MTNPDGEPDWDAIVCQHARQVYAVAMRIVGVEQDAEDVSQEVFSQAWQKWRKGRVNNWSGLLIHLATVRSIDRLRRRRRWWGILPVRDSDRITAIEPPDELQGQELADWLRKAIAALPDREATVFIMIHVEEMTREEVADALAISPEAVSTALYKARQKLQEQLQQLQEKR